MTVRLRREREGRPMAPLTQAEFDAKFGTGYGSSTRTSAEPLRELVRDAVAIEGEELLALQLHVSSKRIREILSGVETVSLVTADRICTGLGFPMSWIYDYENANVA